jgi:hypothetical protein
MSIPRNLSIFADTFDGTNVVLSGTISGTKHIVTGGTAAGNGIYLANPNSVGISTNGSNAVILDSVQNATFTKNISLGNATVTTSGTGITFPATQSASSNVNTLDDYEKGTWTPTASSSIGAITTYTSSGTYTKIGSFVFCQATISVSNIGTASGTMTVSGIPFVANAIVTSAALEVNIYGYSYQFYVSAGGTSGVLISFTNTPINWLNGISERLTFTLSV